METLIQGLAQGLAIGGIYGLITMALTIVYSVTRLLNFAHGDLMVVAMYLAFAGVNWLGIDPYLSILIIAPLMFGFGALLFHLIFARVLRAHVLLVVQVTLGLGFVIQSVLLMVFSANYRTVQSVLTGKRIFIGDIVLQAPYVVAFVVSVLTAVLFFWLLHRSTFGRQVRAVAEDAEAASLSGINVRWVQMIVFAGALGTLGVVGPLVSPVFIVEPTLGLHLSLVAFIVLILGGVTNFIGTFVAGIIIGVAEALGGLYVNPPEFAGITPYAIFILFLLFRPSGVLERS
ncbi:MAG: branched-chain amino acid ABC transporter permease [Roseovarius sp.]|nr:branched-chain amino acid ABC transporter permease [Roseovarius sp.]